ncbi:hypothetical protein P4129_07160 [Pseudomonas aeruginosa]|nr:hypothetical protein [Pseudomonas aeruginosa]
MAAFSGVPVEQLRPAQVLEPMAQVELGEVDELAVAPTVSAGRREHRDAAHFKQALDAGAGLGDPPDNDQAVIWPWRPVPVLPVLRQDLVGYLGVQLQLGLDADLPAILMDHQDVEPGSLRVAGPAGDSVEFVDERRAEFGLALHQRRIGSGHGVTLGAQGWSA